MNQGRSLSRYQESHILNAGREQLLLIVYDGLLRFLARAERGIAERNYDEKCLGISRAQAILFELDRTLDAEAAPELAANLSRIYAHLVEELALADADDDAARLRGVAGVVAELRSAWGEASRPHCTPSAGDSAQVQAR